MGKELYTMKNDKYVKFLEFVERGFGKNIREFRIYTADGETERPSAALVASDKDTFKTVYISFEMLSSVLSTIGYDFYSYCYDPKNYSCIILYKKMPKYYNVKFHYIKDTTMSIETVIPAYSNEEAKNNAIYKASKVLEIHEDLFIIDSVTEEHYE